jgi:hypothetical protein
LFEQSPCHARVLLDSVIGHQVRVDEADGLDEARQQVNIATGRWRPLARPSGSRGTAASLLAQAASMARKACSMELETWPLPEDSTPGDDEPAADQICLLRFSSGFVPVQSFPQAAIAR